MVFKKRRVGRAKGERRELVSVGSVGINKNLAFQFPTANC